eukprot:2946068-Pyramimonas_sp.AAC.1
MAPEMMGSLFDSYDDDGRVGYDLRVDIYAVGMLIYEMFAGKVPFDKMPTLAAAVAANRGRRPTFPDINAEEYQGHNQLHENVFLRLEYIIRRCVAHNPCNRPSLEELL